MHCAFQLKVSTLRFLVILSLGMAVIALSAAAAYR